MSNIDLDAVTEFVDGWIEHAPGFSEVDETTQLAIHALAEAGMVEFNDQGYSFSVHQDFPEAPRSQFKLMIREGPGINTSPEVMDAVTLPATQDMASREVFDRCDYVLGYARAGTGIAAAVVRNAQKAGLNATQAINGKIEDEHGNRAPGRIITPNQPGEVLHTIDDTTFGGMTKIQGASIVRLDGLRYDGLTTIVNRHPLANLLVEEATGETVNPGMHWLTVLEYAVEMQGLPDEVLATERDFILGSAIFQLNQGNVSENTLQRIQL